MRKFLTVKIREINGPPSQFDIWFRSISILLIMISTGLPASTRNGVL